MRVLKKSALAAAAAIAATGVVGIVPAQAAPARPAAIYHVPCWTSFNPTNPDGAPMVQWYANCSDVGVTVCPEVIVNGVATVDPDYRNLGPYDGLADSSDTGVWQWSSTDPAAVYTTVICRLSGSG